MKKANGIGFYFMTIATILAIVACVMYGSVMYKYQPVYIMLGVAIALGVLAVVLTFAMGGKGVFGIVPVINAALMGSAAVWSASLMVNQIGYVVAGLDGMETINGFVYFCVVAVIAMLFYIIASFAPMYKEAK